MHSPGTALFRSLSWIPLAASLIAPGAAGAVTLRNMELKAHRNDYPPVPATPGNWNYSSCWSYIHHDGREYAVLGVGTGTAIYNVTNPAATYQVGFIPGVSSKWREMKQYRNWLYVATEGTGPGEGIQIIRMTNPEVPVLAATYAVGFARSHTVAVDTTRALLICNGTRYNAGAGAYPPSGMRILSLANPEAPTPISVWPPVPITPLNDDSVYVHDSVPVGNRLYASSIYYGIQRVFDFTNPANPVQLAAWSYPGGFTHNAWPDKTGNWLYVTDEKNGEPLKIFDISNLSAPVLFNGYTANSSSIVHNVHVKGDDVFISHYTEGIRVLDATDPGHPAEFAYADSYDGPSGNYDGVWEVCPYFPSGTVIASDMNSGLYVYRPVRNYGRVKVRVVDQSNGLPIAGAKVYRDAAQESLTTTSDGVGVFAMDPGSRSLTAKRFGYVDATAGFSVVAGQPDSVVLSLAPRARASFNGTIRNASTLAGLEEAELSLRYTPLHDHTDGAGAFAIADVPVGTHRVEVRCPGFIPVSFDREIGPGPATMSFQLTPVASWNQVESTSGWSVGAAGDDATTNFGGQWTLVDPLGTVIGEVDPMEALPRGGAESSFGRGGAPLAHEGHRESEGLHPGPVQPEDDRTPSGTKCFVTGQGVLASDYEGFDLDGVTTLTSPTMNANSMAVPTIGYWRWFYTSTGDAGDFLDVYLSNNNGSSWTLVRHLTGMHDHWAEEAIRIADHLAPSNQMKVRFVASDQGAYSVVESAVDDLTLYDAAAVALDAFPYPGDIPSRVALRTPWPNPSSGELRVVLALPRAGRVQVEVLDVQGRRVATVFDGHAGAGTRVLTWDGRDREGATVEAGVYFLRAASGGETANTRFVRVE